MCDATKASSCASCQSHPCKGQPSRAFSMSPVKAELTSACFSISLSAHMAQNNLVAGNYNDYCTHRSEKSYTKIAYLNLDRVGTIARSKNQEDDAF